MDFQAGRKALSEVETSLVEALGPPSPDIEELYHTFTTRSGWETTVKVWRPAFPATHSSADANKGAQEEDTEETRRHHPLILLFHGGGFTAGSIEMLTRPGRDFALAFNAIVVSATYRLAPEHPFPVFMHDAMDVVAWMRDHAEKAFPGTTLDPDQGGGFVVGGFSAGAQAAAVVASEARDRGGETGKGITGLFLGIPSLLVPSIVPPRFKGRYTSHTRSAGATTPETLAALREAQKADVYSPLFSPFNSPLGLSGMPRTYVQVGNEDPLRDDGVIFAEALREAGLEARCDSYEGLGHAGFTIWWDEATEPSGLRENTMEGMEWLLRKGA